jgi:hypothetical protein
VGDFEEANPIVDWDYDPEAWQIVNEGGQSLLIGQGRITQPMVVMGRENPEWLNSSATDFVIDFDVNMDPSSGGARVVFRYQDGVGYNALELFPGLIILRRNAPRSLTCWIAAPSV